MQLIDDLVAEHDLIEQVLGSLRSYAERRREGIGEPADGGAFLRFFRLYAGHFHHAREEEVLFPALVQRAELPADRGPIAAMVAEHARMAGILDQLDPLLRAGALDREAADRLGSLAVAYSHALWHHIDAENSVLLPEAETRLRRAFVRELEGRSATPEEQEAREQGIRLCAAYPPLVDRDVLRGDGCVHCPSFGDGCRGLEREWWNPWEWEEFEDQMPKD